MRRPIVALLVVAAAVCLVAGCGRPAPRESGRLLVVTTTTQVTDFARNVGGDRVDIYPLLKANVDPHDFEASAADLVALGRADVIVENGVGLEGWLASTIKSAEPRGTVVDASRGVAIHDGDPHIWTDPTNARVMATNIADALSAADPAGASTYAANLAAYGARLDALDGDIRVEIDTLANKELVTDHDAFGYYIRRYGLQYVGSVIPSFDTQAELSPTDVHDLVARIRAEGVKAIFTEAALPAKTAAAIAGEAGVKVIDDGLYGDSLGPPGSDGDTYLKMMAHNTRVIVDNLR